MWLSFLVHDYLPLQGGRRGGGELHSTLYIFEGPVSMKVNYVTFWSNNSPKVTIFLMKIQFLKKNSPKFATKKSYKAPSSNIYILGDY
jgi:hypothetical protein